METDSPSRVRAAGSPWWRIISAGVSLSLVISCGSGGEPGAPTDVPAIASVTVTAPSTHLLIGQTEALGAVARNAAGDAISSVSIAWSSDRTTIVSVSSTGAAKALALGSATITATADNVTGSTVITVQVAPIAALTVTPPLDSLIVGQTVTLTATATDSAGHALEGRTIAWVSTDTLKASVTTQGTVTARDSGTAFVRATAEGKSDSARIVIRLAPVASVALTPAGDTIATTGTLQLTAIVRDALGQALTGRQVAWSVLSGPATVSTTGLVTGTGAGTASLRATSEGQSAIATVLLVPCSINTILSVNKFSLPLSSGSIQPLSPIDAGGYFRTGPLGNAAINPAPVLFGGGLLYATATADLTLGYDFAGTIAPDIAPVLICTLPTNSPLTSHTYAHVVPYPNAGPPGLVVRQESWALSGSSVDSGYVLLRYEFTNTRATALTGFYAGFATDWDLGWDANASDDVARWTASIGVGEAAESDSATHKQIMATVPIAVSGNATFASWLNGADPNHAGYFTKLTAGVTTTPLGPGDIRAINGVGPITIPAGGRLVVYFALVGADDRASFNAAVARVRAQATTLGY